MARKPKIKEVINSRLLKEYASWIYCNRCNNTIAYLCYVTYDYFDFNYKCNCQNCGHIHIEFDSIAEIKESNKALSIIKNRLCCPSDNAPLITIIDKNLQSYEFTITCNKCNVQYNKEVK